MGPWVHRPLTPPEVYPEVDTDFGAYLCEVLREKFKDDPITLAVVEQMIEEAQADHG